LVQNRHHTQFWDVLYRGDKLRLADIEQAEVFALQAIPTLYASAPPFSGMQPRTEFNEWYRFGHNPRGKSVIVRINDRGVLFRERIIDLSRGAAEKLGIRKAGVASVRLEVLSKKQAAESQVIAAAAEKSAPAADSTLDNEQ